MYTIEAMQIIHINQKRQHLEIKSTIHAIITYIISVFVA